MSTINSTMGIKTLYYAPINAANPRQMPTTGWKKVEVYQETCTFVDKDPTVTTHKSETSSKKITQMAKEGSELKFKIMDPSVDEKVSFQGGTKVTTGDVGSEKLSYKEAETAPHIQMAFKVYPQAGMCLNVPSATVIGKRDTTYSSKGISLLDVTAIPDYGIEDSEDVTEPAEVPAG